MNPYRCRVGSIAAPVPCGRGWVPPVVCRLLEVPVTPAVATSAEAVPACGCCPRGWYSLGVVLRRGSARTRPSL